MKTIFIFIFSFSAILSSLWSDRIWIYCENGKWGLKNQWMENILPAKYDNIDGFSCGLAPVCFNSKWGYINSKGQEVIPLQYDYAGLFSRDGLAIVSYNGKYGIINTNGEVVCPFQFKAMRYLGDNYAVELDGKYYLVNQFGNILSQTSRHDLYPSDLGFYNVPPSDAGYSDFPMSVFCVIASSMLTEKFDKNMYQPVKVLDGKQDTGWMESVTGPGIGEWIEIVFPWATSADKIIICPGWFDSRYWIQNNRIKKIMIELDDFSIEVSFPDFMIPQEVILPKKCRFYRARFTVLEVYKTSNWDDTCISEIEFWKEDRKMSIALHNFADEFEVLPQ